MNKVIIPIYPDEEEQRYNAHIKARALAGCYHDKKWYGYGGSRNSGKGTETGLLRSAFQDFVMEFNAKCLIFQKIGNPEPSAPRHTPSSPRFSVAQPPLTGSNSG